MCDEDKVDDLVDDLVDEDLIWKDQIASLADLQWRLIQILAIQVLYLYVVAFYMIWNNVKSRNEHISRPIIILKSRTWIFFIKVC